MFTLRNYYPILSFILMVSAATFVGLLYLGSSFFVLGYDNPAPGLMSPLVFFTLSYIIGTLILLVVFFVLGKLFDTKKRWHIIRNYFLLYVAICFSISFYFLIDPGFSGSLNIPFHAENAYRNIVVRLLSYQDVSITSMTLIGLHVSSLSFLYFSLRRLLNE